MLMPLEKTHADADMDVFTSLCVASIMLTMAVSCRLEGKSGLGDSGLLMISLHTR